MRSAHAPWRTVRAVHLGLFGRFFESRPGVPRGVPRHSRFRSPPFFFMAFFFSFFFFFFSCLIFGHGALAHSAACRESPAAASMFGGVADPAAALAEPAAEPRGQFAGRAALLLMLRKKTTSRTRSS